MCTESTDKSKAMQWLGKIYIPTHRDAMDGHPIFCGCWKGKGNSKDKGNSNGEIQGSFTAFRMTTKTVIETLHSFGMTT
jgi:hypothetical protein